MSLVPVQNDLAFIAVREGFVASVYSDAHAPANGFGQNDPSLEPGQITTLEAAGGRLISFCAVLAGEIAKLLPPAAHLEQHEFGALLSLAYNVGAGGAYRGRPGGGLAFQGHLLVSLEVYLVGDDGSDPERRAFLRDMAGKEITRANEDPSTGRPFNASRRWREAILFVAGDYGDLSTLKSWPEGRDPRKDPPEIIPMPRFI